MRHVLLVCLIVLAAPVRGADTAGPLPTAVHEPGGPLDVDARVVSLTDRGAASRVVVDVKLRSSAPTLPLRIGATLNNAQGSEALPERGIQLAQRVARKVRYTLDLEHGLDHHLVFSVTSADDPLLRTSAAVRVNLDPATRPEDLGELLQFRARMEGEVTP